MTKIYDIAKIKFRTFIESINALFTMGSDLEDKVDTGLQSKQDTLVSGTNIKTVNGSSIIGEGNIAIVGENPGIESGDAGKVLKVNALEDGAEWSDSVDVTVPDTPTSEHKAVNQTWVENVAYTDDTVNNIVHKEGFEDIGGNKYFTTHLIGLKVSDISATENPQSDVYCSVQASANNNLAMSQLSQIIGANGDRMFIMQFVRTPSGNTGKLELKLANDGTMTLVMSKTVGGVSTSDTIATL